LFVSRVNDDLNLICKEQEVLLW